MPATCLHPLNFTGHFTTCLLGFTKVHSSFTATSPTFTEGTMFSSVRVPRTVVEVWGLPS